jgi:hypothetical protein
MGSGSRYYFKCAAGGNLVYIFVCTQKCISWHHSYLLPKTAIHLFFATSVKNDFTLKKGATLTIDPNFIDLNDIPEEYKT